MENPNLIRKSRELEEDNSYTVYELSKKIDIPISTLERWLKAGRIDPVYAKMVREKLGIK
jgi:DNA-binding transcriptional ArsR family regulator